jgi:hypothetical protein
VIALAALLVMQPPTEMHSVSEQPRPQVEAKISGPYALIPIKPGINRASSFGPSGEDAVILSAWRDNGNAWGDREYEVFIPASGDWNIVDFNHPQSGTHLVEVPHTGEDALSAIRFVWGFENGRRVALAVTAGREPKEGVPDAAETTITIYSMRPNDEVGTTKVYFKSVKEWTAKRLYCNAEMALHDEFGLPLGTGYQGSRKAGGCD